MPGAWGRVFLSGLTFHCVLPTSSSSYSLTGYPCLGIWNSCVPPGCLQIRPAAFFCDSCRGRWFSAGLVPGFPKLAPVIRGESVFLAFSEFLGVKSRCESPVTPAIPSKFGCFYRDSICCTSWRLRALFRHSRSWVSTSRATVSQFVLRANASTFAEFVSRAPIYPN